MSNNIGILSGTFDPVHGGHIAFALKAIEYAGLDKVIFIPEPVPRRKDGVTHIAHRMAMLKLALRPHNKLEALMLPDKQFSVTKTLPRLKKLFPDAKLYFLTGSDMVDMLVSPHGKGQWPGISDFVKEVTLIVGVRSKRIREEDRQKLDLLQPHGILLASPKPDISSRYIREALLNGKKHRDVLISTQDYIKNHWLYTSPAAAPYSS